jgi:hypothetical protein
MQLVEQAWSFDPTGLLGGIRCDDHGQYLLAVALLVDAGPSLRWLGVGRVSLAALLGGRCLAQAASQRLGAAASGPQRFEPGSLGGLAGGITLALLAADLLALSLAETGEDARDVDRSVRAYSRHSASTRQIAQTLRAASRCSASAPGPQKLGEKQPAPSSLGDGCCRVAGLGSPHLRMAGM